MDFPGSAATNVYLIDGFSTIYWRIYTEEPGIANHPPDGPANGYTILKHLGHLKDLEARLRSHNCLASCPRRLGLWVFSPTPNFESLDSLYVKEGDSPTTKILVDATTLKVSASGSITSQDLIKGLSSESEGKLGAQANGPQRSQQGQSSGRRPDGYSSSAAIYASFVSAITGAISLHLSRRYGALPLGSRTLFTAVEKIGYESPKIDNESVLSTSHLTSLNAQLNATGVITITLQTVSQDGVARLCSPRDDIADLLRVPPGTDLWLCPNGAIARLVTANIESPTAPSPGVSISGNAATKRQQWKRDVVQWLANWGLHIESIDEEPWVEIEVWEPFFARLAGDSWRQGDDQSPLPLKRMLWPARFCFRRCGPSMQSLCLETSVDEPLEFAERWSSAVASVKPNPDNMSRPVFSEPTAKDHDMASPKIDNVETYESLSRMAQYPDLQTTNLVYPTPPDGAAAGGMNSMISSDAFPEDGGLNLSPDTAQDMQNLANPEFSPDVDVGTGRYDASDDEDLFGDMNERDFGAKGITDADFSFFDDPTFENMDEDAPLDPSKDVPQGPEGGSLEKSDLSEEAKQIQSSIQPPTAVEDGNEEGPVPQHEAEPADAPMGDNQAQSLPEPQLQPISPPLSPVEIKRILFAGSPVETEPQSKASRSQQGHYHHVAFEKRLGDWDQKYGTAGKFWFSAASGTEASRQTANTIPTIGLPHRGRAASGQARASGTNAPPQTLENRSRSSSASSTSSSEESVDVPLENAPTPMALPNLKRKRVPSDSDIQSTASPAKSSNGAEGNAGLQTENSTFLGNFLASFSDWTLTGYFSASQMRQLPVLPRREDQIQVAQLLVDQITQSSLNHAQSRRVGPAGFEYELLTLRTHLEETKFPGKVTRLDLKGYTSLQDDAAVNAMQQQSRDSARSPVARVSAPHLRVRRGKDYLETLPPAISFWETFGLQPAHGPKDISAYCIHPGSVAEASNAFLDRFGQVYQSCNFGCHTRGDKSATGENGMRAWDAESSSYASMMHSLKELCEELGSDLSKSPPTMENCVVYIVNPFSHAAALADICAAFWHLFQQLVADADNRETRQVNDVALQIIPVDFIFSGESVVFPAQPEYLNLALEVYSRCRPKDTESNPVLCAPAVSLADPLPKSINFRLAPDKVSPLQDGRNLHIACSKSSDQRWISAAWSDGTGSIQTTMSYCLRYRGKAAARTAVEVRNEIWATTKHIMDRFQARWNVVLVNTEPMDADDVEGWTSLAEHQNKLRPGSLELSIVTVNPIPDLVLELPVSAVTSSVLNPHFSSTPVSTPNPNMNIASPEQPGNAPTPSAIYNAPTPSEPSNEPDSDVVLTDISDESWSVILSHRLNSSAHMTEFRPALASGYLLRRKGATDGEGVFSMTVNLIHSQRPAATHESLLREILGMYRDLASLARARGVRSVQNNTLPWHIATAVRGQELLSYVL